MSDLLAITTEQACRLTGLSKAQLRYWDRSGFFSPSHTEDARYFGRLYNFRDVVGLRTIAALREKVSLQELRRIASWLHEHHDTPWASLNFFVAGRRVYFRDPDTGSVVSGRGDLQGELEITLEQIVTDVRGRVDELRSRADDIGKVARRRHVLHNAHVIAGTRIPTSAVWDFHEAGYDTAGIIRQYPTLQIADVSAAIAFERKRRKIKAS